MHMHQEIVNQRKSATNYRKTI